MDTQCPYMMTFVQLINKRDKFINILQFC